MRGMIRESIGEATPGSTWGTARAARHAGRSERSRRIEQEARQFHWMVAVGFVLLLVPAAMGRLSGWRWRPWPSGPGGYGSIVAEARKAAGTYIPFAFVGW